jgi:hypothetical protein
MGGVAVTITVTTDCDGFLWWRWQASTADVDCLAASPYRYASRMDAERAAQWLFGPKATVKLVRPDRKPKVLRRGTASDGRADELP